MDRLRFERVAGYDEDARYRLIIDGELFENLTMHEVVEKIAEVDKPLSEQKGE